MKTLVVFAHPNPKSFNAAIRGIVHEELKKAGGEVREHDLYTMNFNAILKSDDFTELFQGRVSKDVLPLQGDITWADLLVFIFPTWWGGAPAILKGYFDRVLTNGFAFRYGEKGVEGLLKGKQAMVFQTTGTPEPILQQQGVPEAIRTVTDTATLEFCGLRVAAHEFFYGVPGVSKEDREAMLGKVRQILDSVAATANV